MELLLFLRYFWFVYLERYKLGFVVYLKEEVVKMGFLVIFWLLVFFLYLFSSSRFLVLGFVNFDFFYYYRNVILLREFFLWLLFRL